jgi:predicted nucleic acid-binding protein
MAILVICLDTNYLIMGLVRGTPEADRILEWLDQGEVLITSMVAWYEFQCGPVSAKQSDFMRSLLSEIRPFSELEAEVAARLFAQAGRSRALKVDAMIAATALVARARLATNNVQDFQKFSGLEVL